MDETAAVRMTVSSTLFVKYMARQMTAIAMYSSGELQVKGAMSDLVKLRKLGL